MAQTPPPQPAAFDGLPPLLMPAQLLAILSRASHTPDFFSAPWSVDASTLREHHSKVQGYNDVLHKKDDHEFFQQTRITKNTHAFILNIVRQHYVAVYRGGNFPIDARMALDVTLTYLGNRTSYREIAELFGLSESGVHACVKKIVQIVCDIGGEFIKWPSAQEAVDMEKEFRDVAGFMGVIGVLDGTHIPIKAPNNMKADYINKKLIHSIILMATCDSKKKFTFIDVGFPGSFDDDTVFTSSDLYTGIVENAQAYFPSPSYHIIGDLAFTLSHHLMVPFKNTGKLTQHQVRYNKKLSKTRVIIEHTYRLLKERFRRLQHVDAEISKVPSIVTACCVLHNITRNFPEEEDILIRERNVAIKENIQPVAERALPYKSASEKRNFLSLSL